MLVKEALYRRERDKVMNEKENTHRENERKLVNNGINMSNNSNKSAVELRMKGKPQ
jgi:hypothetical protein